MDILQPLIKHFLLLAFISSHSVAQVVINGQIEEGDTVAVQYYEPFEGFANNFLVTEYGKEVTKGFELKFDISKPTEIKFIIDRWSISLLCEPQDTIVLGLSSPTKNLDNWLRVSGNNARGHVYYNHVYNKVPIEKFEELVSVFKQNYLNSTELILENLKEELHRQTNWVDSLYAKHEVTKYFRDYTITGIHSILAWEVGNLCRKHLEKNPNQTMFAKSAAIKQGVFEMVDPLDPKLPTCLSSYAYYGMYYKELYKTKKNINTSQVIFTNESFIALAPDDIQSHWWGRSIFYNKMYMPGKFDHCEAFQKYKSLYNNERIINYFENSDICNEVDSKANKILETLDTDFFTFQQLNFQGKRLFIDLWATWCAPCKMEFRYYDSSFYDFMEKHKITLVYVSIDKPELKEKWKKEVKSVDLRGYHVLAGNNLQSSIKEVIYENDPMSIPRYILINEEGKILSTDFTRPSEEGFKSEIHQFFHE